MDDHATLRLHSIAKEIRAIPTRHPASFDVDEMNRWLARLGQLVDKACRQSNLLRERVKRSGIDPTLNKADFWPTLGIVALQFCGAGFSATPHGPHPGDWQADAIDAVADYIESLAPPAESPDDTDPSDDEPPQGALPPAEAEALEQYDSIVEVLPDLKGHPKKVYEKLAEHKNNLGSYEAWSKALRRARNKRGLEPFTSPRSGRTGGSVVRFDQL